MRAEGALTHGGDHDLIGSIFVPGKIMATAYLALGSNIGDRKNFLLRARSLLLKTPGVRITISSPLYQTDPVGGPPGQKSYLNAVLRLETGLPPHELLEKCQEIEDRLGRDRPERWSPRTIDLDLLLYDDLVSRDAHLELPHPRMHQRAFVLVPLADVAPDLVHPRLERTIRDLLEMLAEGPAVKRILKDW